MKIRKADEMLRDIETVADIVGFELDGNKNYTYACQLVTNADFECRELTTDEAEEFEDCAYNVRDQIIDFDFEAVKYLNY